MGQPTFVSNNGGIVLYINNNSQNGYGRWMPPEQIENSILTKEGYIKANMTERNKMLTNETKKWIITHPFKFTELGFRRLFNTYFIGTDVNYSFNGADLTEHSKTLLTIYFTLTKNLVFVPAVIAILGCSINVLRNVFNKKNIDMYNLYNLVCFYMFSTIYFITEGQARYAFPFIFIMIYFLSDFLEKFYRRHYKEKYSKQTGNTANLTNDYL
jgi:hypothetical protein